MIALDEELGAKLAFVNACLNGTAALFLVAGRVAIARGARALHKRLMLGSFAISAVFLVCYLIRVFVSGTHRYPGHGAWKAIYLVTLSTHMLLAMVTPPLAIVAIWLARSGRFGAHRRVVRWAWPVWLYVSVTGVLVYVLLYHPPG
jgi:putative membrane protein